MIEFENYDAFALDNPRRLISREVDLGVHWGADGRRFPCWALHYLEETGDIYAQELAGRRRTRLLGTVPADQVDGAGPHAFRARWYATADDVVLAGWADEPHRDLSWVTGRLQVAGMKVFT